MNELERELVFSEAVKAGKRIYYFDVKQSRNGDRYISITESKKIVEGSYENPRVSFEKHKLFLYKEDYDKFMTAFSRTLEVAKAGIVPEVVESAFAEVPESQYESTFAPQKSVVVAEPEKAPVVNETPQTPVKEEDNTFKIDLDF